MKNLPCFKIKIKNFKALSNDVLKMNMFFICTNKNFKLKYLNKIE